MSQWKNTGMDPFVLKYIEYPLGLKIVQKLIRSFKCDRNDTPFFLLLAHEYVSSWRIVNRWIFSKRLKAWFTFELIYQNFINLGNWVLVLLLCHHVNVKVVCVIIYVSAKKIESRLLFRRFLEGDFNWYDIISSLNWTVLDSFN